MNFVERIFTKIEDLEWANEFTKLIMIVVVALSLIAGIVGLLLGVLYFCVEVPYGVMGLGVGLLVLFVLSCVWQWVRWKLKNFLRIRARNRARLIEDLNR